MNDDIGHMEASRILAPQGKVQGVSDVSDRTVRSKQQFRDIRQAAQQAIIKDDGFVVEDESVVQTVGVDQKDGEDEGDAGDEKRLVRGSPKRFLFLLLR